MIPLLFFGLLAALGLTYTYVGQRASKEMKDNEGFFLGERKIGFFALALTLYATQLGGGSLLGAAEEAYSKGWVVLFYPAGMCLGFLILGLGFGARLRRLGLSTVAELFEKVYGSTRLRKIASLISIGTMFFILVGQGVAARKFFGALGYDGTPYLYLSFWGLIITYTVIGGLKAVVNTDVIKALFIAVVLFGVAWAANSGDAVQAIQLKSFAPSSVGNVPWVAWLLMPLLFMLFEQDMAQRCFAAKSARSITLGALLASGLLFFSSLFAVYFGIMANRMGLVQSAGKGVLFEAIGQLTSPLVNTFFAVAFVMVVLSTADSLLCSVASNLALDFPYSKKMSAKGKMVLSQALTLIAGLAAIGCSYAFEEILPLLIQGYEFSVCTLLFPVLAALFLKRPRVSAAVASMLVGALGFFAFRIWPISFPKEIVCLAFSFASFAAVQLLAKRRAPLALEG